MRTMSRIRLRLGRWLVIAALASLSLLTAPTLGAQSRTELTRTLAVDVEYWPTVDPTGVEGSREQKLDAYRELRDALMANIRARFPRAGAGNE